MVARLIKPLIPRSLKDFYKERLHRWRFLKAFRQFSSLAQERQLDKQSLERVVSAWGNPWSAQWEYLAAVLRTIAETKGPVLECGTGLTTLVAGIHCERARRPIWSLEHDSIWARRMRRMLRVSKVNMARVCYAPLKDFGEYVWYDAPRSEMPRDFSVVICDGPPGEIKGGRVGLLGEMSDHLAHNFRILLDDAARETERAVMASWTRQFGVECSVCGVEKPYALVASHR